jgi:PAS domain S-box-containing protein
LASSIRRGFEVPKEVHFWVIVGIMTCGTILYYADRIPLIETAESSLGFAVARHSVHRILSILPVAYAAFVFGLRGGLLASSVIAVLLLPRVFLVASEAEQGLIEVGAFFFIGAFVSWLIDVQNKEKARRKETIVSLEWAQQELRSHIRTIETEERRLSGINAVLGVVSESLELRDILGLAADRVCDVMGVETCLLFLLDEEAGELSLEAYRGVPEEFAASVKRMKVGEGFNGRVAQTGDPLVVEDASRDPRLTTAVVSQEQIQAQLIVPLKSKGKVLGTLCAATRSPREFTGDEIGLLNAIGGSIGVAIENARLYQGERAMAEQLRISEKNYRDLFESAEEAVWVQNMDGEIIMANEASVKLTGYARQELIGMNVKEFLSGEALQRAREVRHRLLRGEALDGPYEQRLTRKDGSEAHLRLSTSLIVRDGEPKGFQLIARDITEEKRMQENLRFYISQVLKAQEGERLRIARELHDDTAQALTGLSRRLDMLVDTLASIKSQLPQDIPKRVEELREQSDTILEGVRRFSRDLRPPVLADLGVLPALKWLATGLENQHRVAANIRVLGEQHRLPDDMELALFRIAQEALNNVMKHSNASAVELTVDFRGDGITMTIADNGKGFELPRSTSDLAVSGKLGLIGMQERARLLGGTLAIHSEPGAGTSVVVTVPAQASSLSEPA